MASEKVWGKRAIGRSHSQLNWAVLSPRIVAYAENSNVQFCYVYSQPDFLSNHSCCDRETTQHFLEIFMCLWASSAWILMHISKRQVTFDRKSSSWCGCSCLIFLFSSVLKWMSSNNPDMRKYIFYLFLIDFVITIPKSLMSRKWSWAYELKMFSSFIINLV